MMNYFSSIKIWVTSNVGELSVFNAPEITVMKRGLFKNSSHIPTRAPGVTPEDFKCIINFLSSLTPPPYVLIAALIIGYFTLARQSNLVLTSTSIVDCPHVLKVRDVVSSPEALFVTLRSSKTRFASLPHVTFRLPALPCSNCCPVRAWNNYRGFSMLQSDSPAFLLPSGSPLTAKILLRALRLTSTALFGLDKSFTLHSLRRGATIACQDSGLTLDSIMCAGQWRSQAVKLYMRPLHISSAPAALGLLLG